MSTETLTPKQQYEARRAKVREARARADFRENYHEEEQEMMTLLFERFVTAAERIADAMEDRK